MRVTHQIETLSHHKKRLLSSLRQFKLRKTLGKHEGRKMFKIQLHNEQQIAKLVTGSKWIGTDAEPSPSVHRRIVKPSLSIFWTV